MKVRELIKELEKYDPEKEIIGTWESTFRDIYVYESSKTVFIDLDGEFYKEEIQSGRYDKD